MYLFFFISKFLLPKYKFTCDILEAQISNPLCDIFIVYELVMYYINQAQRWYIPTV